MGVVVGVVTVFVLIRPFWKRPSKLGGGGGGARNKYLIYCGLSQLCCQRPVGTISLCDEITFLLPSIGCLVNCEHLVASSPGLPRPLTQK